MLNPFLCQPIAPRMTPPTPTYPHYSDFLESIPLDLGFPPSLLSQREPIDKALWIQIQFHHLPLSHFPCRYILLHLIRSRGKVRHLRHVLYRSIPESRLCRSGQWTVESYEPARITSSRPSTLYETVGMCLVTVWMPIWSVPHIDFVLSAFSWSITLSRTQSGGLWGHLVAK